MSFPVGDIKLSANFEVNVAKPIDARFVVQDVTERNSIAFPYAGIIVWVIDDDTHYYLENDLTTWTPIGSGSSTIPNGTVEGSILRWDNSGLQWVETPQVTVTSGTNAQITVDALSTSGSIALDVNGSGNGVTVGEFETEVTNRFKMSAAKVCSTTTIDSSITPSYTISSTDDNIILADVQPATTLTLSLPSGSVLDVGHEVIIKDIGANLSSTVTITVDSSTSDLIEGNSSIVMTTPYDTLRLLWSGSEWVGI